jgi:hypothetical protein
VKVTDIVKNHFSSSQIEFEVSSGFYPFDLYFPKERLVVEINGATHYY